MKQFKDFAFKPFIYKTIETLGFREPTDIQQKVIPLFMKKLDIVGISQTGTGKTHAFLLPIVNQID